MTRSTTLIGHTIEASQILSYCNKGKVIGEVKGMFEEHVCNLHEYIDEQGEVFKEIIQTEVWSAGPNIFLALVNNKMGIIGWLHNGEEQGVNYELGTYNL